MTKLDPGRLGARLLDLPRRQRATTTATGSRSTRAGSAYVTGVTDSADFPTTPGAFDTSLQRRRRRVRDEAERRRRGARLLDLPRRHAASDAGHGIAVDAPGSAYVTGATDSADFPTTAGAFDTSYNGGGDAFVTKLNAAAAPATLTLSPPTATNPVGTPTQ